MRSSSSDVLRRSGILALALAAAAAAAWLTARSGGAAGPANLLRNGGFEENRGPGTIPAGWEAADENGDFAGWIAPRAEREIGGVGPRTGKYLAGCDTEMMGVDTNGRMDEVPRSALFQTIAAPAGSRGTFSVHYNDLGSTALGHVSALRLAYAPEGASLGSIRTPRAGEEGASGAPGAGTWSRPFYRVSQRISPNPGATGDWTVASIPVTVPGAAGGSRVTLWIGIFDHQNSTEIGYWRIDDASFTLAKG